MASLFFSSFFSLFTPQMIFLFLVVVGLIAVIAFIKLKTTTVGEEHKLQYRAVDSVFDKREVMLFQELKKQLPDGYYIFPKIRLADIMETTATGKEYMGQVNRILKKHVDFLICDQYYKPVLAIELNGSSHKTARAQNSDEFKKKAFESIGLRLEIVQVGSDFAAETVSLFEGLNP